MWGKEIWVFVFMLGTLVFNWPLLSIFGGATPYALFGLWALLIACIGALNAVGRGRGIF